MNDKYLWKQSSKIKTLVEKLGTAEIIPIYKRTYPKDPGSSNLTALLSHARKANERAIAIELMCWYKYSNAELGLERKPRTDATINRHTANGQELKYSAVLDLKLAYSMVPGEKLVEVVTSESNNTNP